MVDKKMVMMELKKVIDPEIGIPVTEMKMIDKIFIKAGNVTIDFHLSMPYCPAVFATEIARGIKTVVSKIKGVESVRINLKNHYMAEQINKEVNKN